MAYKIKLEDQANISIKKMVRNIRLKVKRSNFVIKFYQ